MNKQFEDALAQKDWEEANAIVNKIHSQGDLVTAEKLFVTLSEEHLAVTGKYL